MGLKYTQAVDILTDTLSEKSAGVTIDTTGTGYDVSKRQQITIQFAATGIVGGNGVFTVDASNNGTNWVTGIAYRDLSSTSPLTYVTSVTLNATGTSTVKIPSGWRFIRAVLDMTTDGTYFAFMENAG